MYEIQNFLPHEWCDYVIQYFSNVANFRRADIGIYRDTFTYKILEYEPIDFYIQSILNNMIRSVEELYNKVDIYNTEIVFWDKGSKQSTHNDIEFFLCTSVIYLNDDFDGGETYYLNSTKDKVEIIDNYSVQYR